MKRVFYLSLIFFLIQVCFVALKPNFVKDIYTQLPWEKIPRIFYVGGLHQRRVYTNLKKLHTNNKNKDKAIYILGGSTAREFFLPDDFLHNKLGVKVHNMAGSSQSLYDSLRIIDNIKTPGSVVVYLLYPIKFYNSELLNAEKANYINGSSYLYPIESRTLDKYFEDQNLFTPKSEYTIFKSMNVFASTLKSFVPKFPKFIKSLLRGQVKLNKEASKQYLYEKPLTDDEFKQYAQKVRKNLNRYIDLKTEGGISHYNFTQFEQGQADKLYQKNLEFNAEIMQLIQKVCTDRSLRLVLIEAPLAQRSKKFFGKEIENFNKFRKEKLSNIDYFGLDHFGYSSPYFSDEYFNDIAHLLSSGREYFSDYALQGLIYGRDQ